MWSFKAATLLRGRRLARLTRAVSRNCVPSEAGFRPAKTRDRCTPIARPASGQARLGGPRGGRSLGCGPCGFGCKALWMSRSPAKALFNARPNELRRRLLEVRFEVRGCRDRMGFAVLVCPPFVAGVLPVAGLRARQVVFHHAPGACPRRRAQVGNRMPQAHARR